MNYPNQRTVSPRPGYPPQPLSGSPMQLASSPDQRRAQQPSPYRRRRSISRFQIRMGSLGFVGCAAGIYLEMTGQAKNPTASVALIGGGGLIFVLFLLLPLFLRR